MKKLMFAAAACALAGVAVADPLVYDYKSSVKQVYLREIKVKDATGTKVPVYQKFQKSASIKGYLIVDNDGVTSPVVTGNASATCYDQGRNRAFLVVLNKNITADCAPVNQVKWPKILPAVFEAKWYDTKLDVNKGRANSGIAEGYLFAGGESIACLRPRWDVIAGVDTERGADTVPAANTPGMVAYSDYVWTSVYLFGCYNGPNWFGYQVGANPFDLFEAAWDGNLPADVKTGRVNGDPSFHDTWLNGAGIGKYTVPGKTIKSGGCCGLQGSVTYHDPIVESLSGQLKGGIFLCTDNGILVDDYEFLGGIGNGYVWDDQFVTAGHWTTGTYAGDKWQTDLWQDGAVEQETTDVVFGSWSIKLNTKGIAAELTDDEKAQLTADGYTYVNTQGLLATIKGCAEKLRAGTNFYDGREIHRMTPNTRFDIPMITPQFVKFYGLVD